MKNFPNSTANSSVSQRLDLVITGIGITSAVGLGREAFTNSLLEGNHKFGIMQRPGRQIPEKDGKSPSAFLGAEIDNLTLPHQVPESISRTASFAAQVALATLYEAWEDAKLTEYDPSRIGLIVGGSNIQQRETALTHDRYRNRVHFLRPSYGFSFMDSDLCGLCTETFGIRGMAYTVGGASASGQLAIIQAMQAVQSGQVDVCIALGALMDLSYWEVQGFRSLGAMGSDKFSGNPEAACRPFDKDRDGFIFGENCGAVVVERADLNRRSGATSYARLVGFGLAMDGNRNPNPSFEGEVEVLQQALASSGFNVKDIDYVNPHGTGSHIGDETELRALRHCDLGHCYLNATKSIIGHGLTAAGTVETIATLIQMKTQQLHPSRNLENPMEDGFNWVRHKSISHSIQRALSLSMGFGGINTALCLEKI